MSDMKVKIFLLSILFMTAFGCGSRKEDLNSPDNTVSNVIGMATDDPNLKILVSYIDATTYPGKRIVRLKLVNDAQFAATLGYKFLGRAYSKDTPGLRGFGLPLYEYYIPFGSPYSAAYGFNYSLSSQCSPGFNCPWDSTVLNRDPVVYMAPPQLNVTEGIVPLYQYSTPGGFTSGGTGNVSFTVDEREMIGLQQAGIQISSQVIGSLFHGTANDCKQVPSRSVFCGVTY